MMKKWIIMILTGVLCGLMIVCCACGNSSSASKDEPKDEPAETVTEQDTSQDAQPQESTIDVSSLTWVDGELDCYDYDDHGVPCYAKFQRPAEFQQAEQNDDGEQYRGYWYTPGDGYAADSLYGIYAYFMQGGYGGHKDGIEEGLVGGQFEERQLGGRTVLFGLMSNEGMEGATGYTYCYYVPYDDDDWARIWILVQDQEENGLFRQTFENSLSFEK